MEACLGEELPAPTELEEALRNGVILAKLGQRFAPAIVPLKKIYDPEQLRYKVCFWSSSAATCFYHLLVLDLVLVQNPFVEQILPLTDDADVFRLWVSSSVTPTISTTGGTP